MIIKAYKNDKEINLNLLGTVGYKCDRTKVVYKCDGCDIESKTSYNALYRKNRLDKQFCRKCTIKLNGVVEQRKVTCLKKYGVDNPMKVSEFVDKSVNNIDYEKQRNSIDDIKKQFIKDGFTLLTTKYKNRTQKLRYICPNGHQDTITYSSWNRGSRCNECAYILGADKKRFSYEFVKESFEREGYTLLTKTYNNKFGMLKFKCPKGHIHSMVYQNWMAGHRCGKCSHIVSKAETDVYNFIKQFLIDAVQSNRSLIKPFELDIVIPSKKIAIEYNGLYYHSESMGKDKNYHLNKLQKCNEIGYKLITIFEDEWINKQNIVKHRLMHILNVSEANSIHARKCVIKEINATVKNEFLNKFHIQGADRSSIKLGAFYNDQLVSLMTFSKGSIAKGGKTADGIYELNRFCSDHDYIISGIANRLFKHFIRNYNPTEIFTYGDKRWSDGNLYKHLGFDFVHDSAPNYWYIDGCNRIHRFNFRKSVLKDKLEIFDESLSEIDNMRLNGWDRIWDCGNVRWSYNNTKD